jgi:hypothetical protein
VGCHRQNKAHCSWPTYSLKRKSSLGERRGRMNMRSNSGVLQKLFVQVTVLATGSCSETEGPAASSSAPHLTWPFTFNMIAIMTDVFANDVRSARLDVIMAFCRCRGCPAATALWIQGSVRGKRGGPCGPIRRFATKTCKGPHRTASSRTWPRVPPRLHAVGRSIVHTLLLSGLRERPPLSDLDPDARSLSFAPHKALRRKYDPSR